MIFPAPIPATIAAPIPASSPSRHRRLSRVTAALALLIAALPHCLAQQSIHLRGTVVNPSGEPIPAALVTLETSTAIGLQHATTDASGAFTFRPLQPGNYTIRAEKAEAHSHPQSLTLTRDQTALTLTLTPARQEPASSMPAMEFADQPNFTIAGVTDWTAVGGHGSDAILRTSEDLSRQTLALKPTDPSATSPSNASHPNPHYDQAEAAIHAGNLVQARQHLQALLAAPASTPQQQSVQHLLAGKLYEQIADPLAAVHEYEEATRLDPSEENYFEWGSELLLHRAVWQAREVFSKAALAYPGSARIQAGLGTALFAGARYEDAAMHLCAASDLEPAAPEPYLFMGRVELAAPNPLPCVEEKLARFARQQPTNALASYFYAMSILKQQQSASSPDSESSQHVQQLLTQAVTLDPHCSDAYLQLGILASSQHKLPQAIDFYTKAIAANPQLSDAHYRLGVAYDRTGQPAKAKEQFQLHDELEKQQLEEVERQRREVKQFQVVLEHQPAPAH